MPTPVPSLNLWIIRENLSIPPWTESVKPAKGEGKEVICIMGLRFTLL